MDATTDTTTAAAATAAPTKKRMSIYERQEILQNEINEETAEVNKRIAKRDAKQRALGNINIKIRELHRAKRNRKHSADRVGGFSIPFEVSPEMKTFMGLPDNAVVCRQDFNKFFSQYVRDHNLRDPNARRHIIPDEHIEKLLSPEVIANIKAGNTFIDICTIQTFVKNHYLHRAVSQSSSESV